MDDLELKFITDQNISPQTTAYLKELGLDVTGIRDEELPDWNDLSLYARAEEMGRVLITYDVDAASYLCVKRTLPGVILIRVQPQIPEILHPALKIFFEKVDYEELSGSMAVVNNQSYKILTGDEDVAKQKS
jgi:predicted nuclease of predicted toxin-antitoxin system